MDRLVSYAGFNLLLIENNHIDDYENGKQDTKEALKIRNIDYVDN